jgi:multiple antibiotic resistance protein
MFDFKTFLLSFIPLFVAIDVIGAVPLFISLTNDIEGSKRNRLITDSTLTALIVAVIFLFGGKMIFNYLGITENDFRVGGGILLLILSVVDLVFSSDKPKKPDTTIGVVPLGIPLIIGPAALTTILIIVDQYGYIMAITAILVNLIIVWAIFRNSSLIMRLMGEGGSKAFAKVAALLMAAIAIMMIRVGMTGMIRGS